VAGSGASFDVERLHPVFAAKLHGLDLGNPLPEEILSDIMQEFETHSVLVFPGQKLESAAQVRFSECFGPLERAISRQSDSGSGIHVSHLSNVDDKGAIIPPDDRKQLFHAANRFWHTDSSYKPQPALASLLYAVEVPPSGGETEFASTRAAFRMLPPEKQAMTQRLWAVHDFQRSRDMIARDLVDESVQDTLTPVSRPLVRVNPKSGERSLYIASHADYIEGMTREESRPLLDELLDWCTQPSCVHIHRWTVGDLVMWDNRCTLHRGRPWDAAAERRVMARTTVIDVGYDQEPGIEAHRTAAR
jgi:alpha-ketoglutarate-dependent 2,4-dichlorophenoxyacetate dioxygenase